MTKNSSKKHSGVEQHTTYKATLLGAAMVALVAGTGCATTLLLSENQNYTTSQTVTHTHVLVEDNIVAFGRPAQPLPDTPSASLVIVGEKNSYVLTRGGTQMISLLSNLSAEYIQVDKDMDFYSPNNDGYFQGAMALSYARPKSDFLRADYEFFLQNDGTDCTTQTDSRRNLQRFCFNVPIKGAVYPQVNNLDDIRSQYQTLSRPYAVSVYTETTTEEMTTRGGKPLQTLVVLPFALAFDVVTSPFLMLLILAN